ncbi:hypothetical protein ATCC90586_007383 [Pythium insidiosum]|nr:hypothetical protein ATCC90586_007383 [Pythium insidiosum]
MGRLLRAFCCVAVHAFSTVVSADDVQPLPAPHGRGDASSLAVDVRRSGALTTTRVPTTLSPGTIVKGYELVERTALLGVCNPLDSRGEQKAVVVRPTGAVVEWSQQRVDVDAMEGEQRQQEDDEAETESDDEVCPLVERVAAPESERDQSGVGTGSELVPDGPTLEYQCVLEATDDIYVNSNYRLRDKFAAGSHGEVWRATSRSSGGHPVVLKRLFVERDASAMLEMGLREAHFGALLRHERHVARFVEYFVRPSSVADADARSSSASMPVAPYRQAPRAAPGGADETQPPPSSEATAELQELWLVFFDEGISLRNYLYASRESAHSAVVFEPSPFWERLRRDECGENVLREILRQVLEGVAALHRRGITHRDIKPSNILVHVEAAHTNASSSLTPPTVKLADLGSAVDDHTLHQLYTAHGPTQAEETREYQPPEVLFSAAGAPYDPAYPLAYDLWSVGVVFLEMVLGSPQVFLISARERARVDATLRHESDDVKRKSYLLHVLTQEFCIFRPSSHELRALWNQYALVSDGCHFGRFNTTIVQRDPKRRGLFDRWGLDLMWKLLQWHPAQRISAQDALEHAFFRGAYTCAETGRAFATRQELLLHEQYLAVQRQRDAELAMLVRERYEVPSVFHCPRCRRAFSTVASCTQHLVARQHATAEQHFCEYAHTRLRDAVRLESAGSAARKHGARPRPALGVAVFQGKKKYMEDAVVTADFSWPHVGAVTMVAVVDGHLGTGATRHIQDHLVRVVEERLAEPLGRAAGAEEQRVALRQVFLELHDGFLERSKRQRERHGDGDGDGDAGQKQDQDQDQDFSGATLTVVLHLVDQQRLLSANVGDSSAILLRDDELTELTTDHWPNVPEERARVESSGGFVSLLGLWRVVGQLAVSRSIGDRHLRQFVTAEPFVYLGRIASAGDDAVVIAASDGLWEAMERDEVARFVADHRRHAPKDSAQAIAEALVEEAYVRGSPDNIAVILLELQS